MTHIMSDVDGVVYDFGTNFYAWAGHHDYQATEWSFYKEWGWTTEQFIEELNSFGVDGGFANDIPLNGSQESISRLLDYGHRVTFVTDIPKSAESDRAWWINFYFPGAELIVSKDKTCFIDGESEGPFWGIDDKIENVDDLCAAAIKGYVLDRPWNTDALHLPRVKSLDEFVDLVLH